MGKRFYLFFFVWFPGHVGISCDLAADLAAKDASDDIYTLLFLSFLFVWTIAPLNFGKMSGTAMPGTNVLKISPKINSSHLVIPMEEEKKARLFCLNYVSVIHTWSTCS